VAAEQYAITEYRDWRALHEAPLLHLTVETINLSLSIAFFSAETPTFLPMARVTSCVNVCGSNLLLSLILKMPGDNSSV